MATFSPPHKKNEVFASVLVGLPLLSLSQGSVDDGVGSVASTAVLSTPRKTNDMSLKEGPFQKV